jgi:hypothetical protein
MRGIADAQEPRPVPCREPVHRHGQELDLVPVFQLADAIRELRHALHKVGAKRVQPGAVHVFD